MKISISTDGEMVAQHFGRCPSFTIVDFDGNKVISKEKIENPGHHPGYIPQFLQERGVNCIVAGGMGRRASDLFQQRGIDAVLGITGSVDDVIEEIIAGTLKGGESLCKPGAGRGYGVEKDECDHTHEEG
jgi:predicted Fe-Mo cluster-binding NifX family protein